MTSYKVVPSWHIFPIDFLIDIAILHCGQRPPVPYEVVMPAAQLPLTNDLRIEQGADWLITLHLEQPKGTPYDLTGKTLRAWLKNDYTDAVAAAAFTTLVVGPATDGVCTISLTEIQTAALLAGDYVWDLLVDVGGVDFFRLFEGPAEVTARVTV